ncbi:MAG: alpha/beta hydrolase, partial [Actinobacteria bacterium]|nr:alpha/beta hydrolase [Actinomycetota bacterium]
MNRTRRLIVAIATVVVVSVSLSGCLYSQIPEAKTTSTASATPATEGIAADLLPYYEQQLTWSSCDSGFDCTTVRAPLDWTDPTKGDIELAVIRHRATGSTTLGSLLTNPGGPGASG